MYYVKDREKNEGKEKRSEKSKINGGKEKRGEEKERGGRSGDRWIERDIKIEEEEKKVVGRMVKICVRRLMIEWLRYKVLGDGFRCWFGFWFLVYYIFFYCVLKWLIFWFVFIDNLLFFIF